MVLELNPLKWFASAAKPSDVPQLVFKPDAKPGSLVEVPTGAVIVPQPEVGSAKAVESVMAFDLGKVLQLLEGAAKPIVLGIETVVGDARSGADKQQMAKDALAGATATADAVLTGDNAQLADVASMLTGLAIDSAVASLKIDGKYQSATAKAATFQASAVAK